MKKIKEISDEKAIQNLIEADEERAEEIRDSFYYDERMWDWEEWYYYDLF